MAVDDALQDAIRQAVYWSKPSVRSWSRWTPDIGRLTTQLKATRREARTTHGDNQIKAAKKLMAEWRQAISKAEWAHWEATFEGSERSNIVRAMRARINREQARESQTLQA